ncbi:MAG: PAS domain S-box protein [Verrucomicrobiota bacterium]
MDNDAERQPASSLGGGGILSVNSFALLLNSPGSVVQSLLNAVPDPFYIKDSQSRLVFVNTATAQVFNRAATELIGKTDYDLFPRSLADQFSAEEQVLLTSGVPVVNRETRIANPPAKLRWELTNKVALQDDTGKIIGLLGINHDITDRKQTEEQLLIQGQALAAAANGIVITDSMGTIRWVNPAFTRLTGYTADEAFGANPRILKSDRHDAAFYRQMWETIKAGAGWHGEVINKRKDGSLYTEEMTITPVGSAGGAITHFIAIKQDVTARKQAAEALQDSADRLKLATRIGGVGIWEYDVPTNRLAWDDQMFRLYGITREQFSGAYEAWRAGVHPDDQQRGHEEIQMALRGEKDFNTEFRVLWPDGSTHSIRAIATVQRDAAGHPLKMVGTNWDITASKLTQTKLQHLNADLEHSQLALHNAYEDLKHAQIQLIQAEKIKMVDRLAAGVAHEVRNPLAIITMGLGYLESNLPRNQPAATTILASMHEAVKRADTILSELMDFSSSRLMDLAEQDIGQLADRSLLLIKHELDLRHIEVVRDFAPGVPLQRVDRIRIEQVFVNLFMNAIQAMPDRGRLTVRTLCTATGAVVAEICDTGHGIPAAQLEQVFDPFFTTKPVGTGTGLGLTVSRSILLQHGGDLVLANQPGGGVCARMLFNNTELEARHEKT